MKQQINLYQPMFRRQRKVFTAAAMAQLIGVLLVGLVIIGIYAAGQVRKLEGQLARSTQQYEEAQQRLLSYQEAYPPRVRSELLDQQLLRARAELAVQQQLEQILTSGAFGNTTGFSGHLTALARQRVTGAWLTRILISHGGEAVGLAGRSLAPELIPDYVQRLGAEPAFAGQGFSALDIVRMADNPRLVEFWLRSSGIEPGDVDG